MPPEIHHGGRQGQSFRGPERVNRPAAIRDGACQRAYARGPGDHVAVITPRVLVPRNQVNTLRGRRSFEHNGMVEVASLNRRVRIGRRPGNHALVAADGPGVEFDRPPLGRSAWPTPGAGGARSSAQTPNGDGSAGGATRRPVPEFQGAGGVPRVTAVATPVPRRLPRVSILAPWTVGVWRVGSAARLRGGRRAGARPPVRASRTRRGTGVRGTQASREIQSEKEIT